MPNYKKGKIYKIYSLSKPDLCFVGSTTTRLCCKLSIHKVNHKKYLNKQKKFSACFTIFTNATDYRIELLEETPCDNKEQLNQKEGGWIQKINCLNKNSHISI